MLCIGGPLHGQYKIQQGGKKRFTVPVRGPYYLRDVGGNATPETPVVHYHAYREYVIRRDGVPPVYLWIPEHVKHGRELEFILSYAIRGEWDWSEQDLPVEDYRNLQPARNPL